jgi:L-ascorbate metabolism protein UlaG (beta-lactamase superfamily)
MENFNVNHHASICLCGNIYIDPLNIQGSPNNAGLLLITHPHFDHLSVGDIKKVINKDTRVICPDDCYKVLEENGISLKRGAGGTGIKVETFPAYNIDKDFHKREKNWVGYIIEAGGVRYAVCGDTDFTPELAQIKCDVLFIPMSGKYTMNAAEAAECANAVRPKLAVPVHYLMKNPDGSVLGGRDDERLFIEKLDKGIKYKIVL